MKSIHFYFKFKDFSIKTQLFKAAMRNINDTIEITNIKNNRKLL
jgi:hypothetical protein